jgi:transcriptional regulator with XRE-family HTH domain
VIVGSYRSVREDGAMTDAPESDAGEAAVAVAIGASVRRARTRSGLSTRELAHRAAVSQPFLSNIENGRSTPSVATLYKLAGALGVGTSELLPGGAEEGIEVARAGEGAVSGVDETPGAALATLLTGGPGRLMESRRFTIRPGQPAGDHFEHAGEDLLHVLHGELHVELGGPHQPLRTERLRAGDSLWHHGTIPHRWTVGAQIGAELLLVTAQLPGLRHG